MLSFVQTWFAAGANPVGVDFGTECLRMAQVEQAGDDFRLVAAASAAVPAEVRDVPAARLVFLATKLRELWAAGNFRGRQAVFALPAAKMYVQHLRLPRMDDASIRKALPWEAQGKLPIDPSTAILRHLVAGEVNHEQSPCSEVIVLAAQRDTVEGLLSAAGSARLDVVGINVEPKALVDCFLHIYRRKDDAEATNCFVDIGASASRTIVARAGKILFARILPIGGVQFTRAVASEFDIPLAEARELRTRLAVNPQDSRGEATVASAAETSSRESATGGGVATLERVAVSKTARHAVDRQRIQCALQTPLGKIVEELSLCRRYHDAAFPRRPIERLIFVGGEACHRELCQHIAKKLGLAAQIGDPLVRMRRTTPVGVESGIDRRQPQPAWAVALGLSMGSIGSIAK